MTTTTNETKSNRNTKTAGYKEALNHSARVALGMIEAGTDPLPVLAPMIVAITALFARPTEKVMDDLGRFIGRGLVA